MRRIGRFFLYLWNIEDELGIKASRRAAEKRMEVRRIERLWWLEEEERKLIRGEPSDFDRYNHWHDNPYRVARECIERAEAEL